jgi:arabinogalactan oligomer/maltooligosaccharide transport system substrate-binding protein
MSKKILSLISIMLIAAFVLTACGAAATPTPTPKPVTIKIWHQWSGDYLTAIEQVFKDYSASHPWVTIDLSTPADTSNALNVAIPAGEGPDIIGWANDQIGTQALVGNIVDLDQFGVDLAFLQSVYEPAAIAGVQYGGKIWALPETQEGIGLVYNKAVLTQEYMPTDLADLLVKAKAFAEANPGKYLVCNQGFPGGDAYHIAPIFFGSGLPAYVDETGKAYLNTPEALKAGEWILEMSKYALPEESHDICKAALIEGTVAAWWTGPWAIADIEKAGVDYGILAIGRPFVGIKTLMMTKNAVDRGNQDVALDIMKYYTSADVQKGLSLINKTIPAQTAALNDPEVAALKAVVGFGGSLNKGIPMSASPYAGAQWGPVGNAVAAIWTGAQTPADALAAAQTAIDEAVAGMK